MAFGADFQTQFSLITSVIALSISFLTFGWTIYRDAIRKPKFRVTIEVNRIVQAGRPPEAPFVSLSALNLGPDPNRIGLPFARKNWIKRKFTDKTNGQAFIYPDYAHQATTTGSPRVEVGDIARFAFPYDATTFLKEDFAQIGLSDGYGTIHWCKRKQLRKLRAKYLRDFPI